jgi:cation diffusion facilitator family transporter
MRTRPPYRLPEDKRPLMKRAIRLQWLTILGMGTVIAVIALTMGESQAMRTALVEDVLALIPPIGFLVSRHYAAKPPSERFPFGRHRLVTLAYLAAGVTLFGMGLFLLYESVEVLLSGERLTIGMVEVFGYHLWLGWLMLAANAWAGLVPFLLARQKLPVARDLHEKVLYADARVNRADWLTAATAAAGIVGIGLGFWWADAVAAGIISLDITHDGYRNLRQSVADMIDERPTTVGDDDPDPVLDRVREHLEAKAWVKQAQVRLREEGHVLTGDAHVVVADDHPPDIVGEIEKAVLEVESLDWRLYDVSVVPGLRLREK